MLKTLCRAWRCVVLALALVVLGGLWHLSRGPARAETPPDESRSDAAAGLQWCGVGSCAAAACHGGSGPHGSPGSEYTIWIRNDPHARAYSVLLDDRSRRMVGSLKDPEKRSAWEHPLCLGCHVRNDPQAAQIPAEQRQDGVGCENCHGPAGNWVSRHYLDDWKTKTLQQKREFGMTDTTDLGQRAEACARCHVGTPDHDVNHDLIAAGHPRLNFEFAAYLDLMPKHWDVSQDKQRTPDLEIRAWTIGQLVSARAALRLLADRAEHHARGWPEFAEYDCYACHHSLRTKNWQSESDYAGRTPGSLPWGTWYFSLLPRALPSRPVSRSDHTVADIDKLRQLMQAPNPDAATVAKEARDRANDVNHWLDDILKGPLPLPSLQALTEGHTAAADLDWDRATQIYCALAAYYQYWQDSNAGRRDAALEGRLQELVALLRFPEPRPGAPRPNSPANYDRGRFLKRLQELPLNR